MNLDQHIECLVLGSLDVIPKRHHLLQVFAETELIQLLTERGLSPQLTGGDALPLITRPRPSTTP